MFRAYNLSALDEIIITITNLYTTIYDQILIRWGLKSQLKFQMKINFLLFKLIEIKEDRNEPKYHN
jgi:hypothetical protein